MEDQLYESDDDTDEDEIALTDDEVVEDLQRRWEYGVF
jgi:hypothetical protein